MKTTRSVSTTTAPPAATGVPTAKQRVSAGWRALTKKQRHWVVGITIVIVLGIIGAITGSSSSNNDSGGSGGSGGGGGAPAATFNGTADSYQILDPSEASITIHVTNTASVAGKPTFCDVQLQSDTGHYNGHASDDRAPMIQPGDTWTDNVTMSISNDGAAFITGYSVDCS